VKIVIVGCGRVGASAADQYDRAGHEVIVLDQSTTAFDRLPSTFGGNAIRGDGTDEDVLRRAGAEGADIFLTLTEGDNRNVMAAQLAIEALDVRRVIAKINDPVRAAAYAELGIATLCRTGLMLDAIDGYLGLPLSGIPGLHPPSGNHDGTGHPEAAGNAAAPSGVAPSSSPATVPTATATAPTATIPNPTATPEV
jgi:trk system potassium uptake protein TrkA